MTKGNDTTGDTSESEESDSEQRKNAILKEQFTVKKSDDPTKMQLKELLKEQRCRRRMRLRSCSSGRH